MSNVEVLRPILQTAWGPDTCDPHDLANWSADNPARGQCGTTAMVIQDLLGGELIMGEVHVDGLKVGHHWWNRLPDGTEVDLTAGQFHPGETVNDGVVRHRPPDAPSRCRGQYELLRHRVLSTIAHATAPTRPPPPHPRPGADRPEPPGDWRRRALGDEMPTPPNRIAVVAVTDPTGAVLLHLRDPDAAAEPGQWSLPGGHVDAGETPAQAAARELAEETGLTARLRPIWRSLRPDLTGSAPAIELHAFAGAAIETTIVLGEGRAALFVPVGELSDVDLSPTAAAVLHRILNGRFSSRWRKLAPSPGDVPAARANRHVPAEGDE